MEARPFELGIMVGRFQTFHAGHEYMVNKAAAICERMAVFIGSSQESGTQKNPYDYSTRERMLRKVFGDRVEIYPLPDIGVGNNSKWGDYVLESVRRCCGRTPDLLVSGKEERRLSWFDSVEGLSIAELYVPKVIEISATQLRGYLLDGDRESWQSYTDPKLWDEYETLRSAVIAAQGNKETASQ